MIEDKQTSARSAGRTIDSMALRDGRQLSMVLQGLEMMLTDPYHVSSDVDPISLGTEVRRSRIRQTLR